MTKCLDQQFITKP